MYWRDGAEPFRPRALDLRRGLQQQVFAAEPDEVYRILGWSNGR
jgi:hypothetical protein